MPLPTLQEAGDKAGSGIQAGLLTSAMLATGGQSPLALGAAGLAGKGISSGINAVTGFLGGKDDPAVEEQKKTTTGVEQVSENTSGVRKGVFTEILGVLKDIAHHLGVERKEDAKEDAKEAKAKKVIRQKANENALEEKRALPGVKQVGKKPLLSRGAKFRLFGLLAGGVIGLLSTLDVDWGAALSEVWRVAKNIGTWLDETGVPLFKAIWKYLFAEETGLFPRLSKVLGVFLNPKSTDEEKWEALGENWKAISGIIGAAALFISPTATVWVAAAAAVAGFKLVGAAASGTAAAFRKMGTDAEKVAKDSLKEPKVGWFSNLKDRLKKLPGILKGKMNGLFKAITSLFAIAGSAIGLGTANADKATKTTAVKTGQTVPKPTNVIPFPAENNITQRGTSPIPQNAGQSAKGTEKVKWLSKYSKLAALGKAIPALGAILAGAHAIQIMSGDGSEEEKIKGLAGLLGGTVGASIMGSILAGAFAFTGPGAIAAGLVGAGVGYFGGEWAAEQVLPFIMGSGKKPDPEELTAKVSSHTGKTLTTRDAIISAASAKLAPGETVKSRANLVNKANRALQASKRPSKTGESLGRTSIDNAASRIIAPIVVAPSSSKKTTVAVNKQSVRMPPISSSPTESSFLSFAGSGRCQ